MMVSLLTHISVTRPQWVNSWNVLNVCVTITALILGLRPTNERRRCCVTTSLIGWVIAYNQSCHNVELNMYYHIKKERDKTPTIINTYWIATRLWILQGKTIYSGLWKVFQYSLSAELCITSPGIWISLNSLRPRQHGRLFADDTFKRIFLNENIRISTKISLKFVPKGLINNIPALVLIMAWRRPGDKPLSEPMLVRSLTHICVTRPQWVN